MDYKSLKYYVTVVESGTISAAAKKLYMSQPPLSNQMYKLEEELGCRLFERTTKRIVLTGVGKLLYDRAKLVIQNIDVLKEEISDYDKKHSGVVRIGMVSSVADTEIAARIAEFARLHPGVTLDIFESNTYQMLERLNARTLHFYIVRTPFVPTHFKQETLINGRVVAMGKKNFFDEENAEQAETTKTGASAKTGRSDTISLADLAGKPIILYRRWEAIIGGFFDQHQLPFHVVCRNDDARTSLFYAEQGVGVALMPISAAHSEKPDIVCKEIEGDPWKTDIVLLYDDATYLPECAKDLRDFLLANREAQG